MATTTATTAITEKRRPGRPRKGGTPDVGQTIRLPSAVREGLLALAKHRGTSVSDIVRDHIPGMDWYATQAGQHALATLEHVIALSTSVHKSFAEFAPVVGEPGEWQSLPVTQFGTVNKDGKDLPRYVHVVRQCEYETRNDAVRNYAQKLWGQLALVKSEHERTALLSELCDDNQHAYVVGFIGLRSWHVFPSSLELTAYEKHNPRPHGVAPTTPEQLRVYTHFESWFGESLDNMLRAKRDAEQQPGRHVLYVGAQQLLTELETHRSNDTRPGETTDNDDDPGLSDLLNSNGLRLIWSADGTNDAGVFEFRWFPDESADECVRRWARQMVACYVEFVSAYTNKDKATPERFIRVTQPFGYAVYVLRWLTTARKMNTQ